MVKTLLTSALKWIGSKTAGYKTYVAAVGLVGLAAAQFSQDNYDGAARSLLEALGFIGLRSALVVEVPDAGDA